MPDSIQLVIVDDHPLFREGVAATLQQDPFFQVVAEGKSADDALHLAQEHLPDLLLLDIAMPGGGLEAAKKVALACPVTKIVMLTFSEEEDNVLSALKAGAKGYILKGVLGSELRSILKRIYEGEVFITPMLAASVLVDMVDSPKKSTSDEQLFEELTQREREILELLAEGGSNKSIGAKLGITEKTVKHYMSNILAKLQVKNRVEAALLAQKLNK
ncbi:MAG: response regulator transcription factor [Trueperaceae bacterium]|nr:response regulator transcription factor [Trueperaceae bacterium]